MAEINRIVPIESLDDVRPQYLDEEDFLVVYQGEHGTTNKVTIGSLKEKIIGNEYSLFKDSQHTVIPGEKQLYGTLDIAEKNIYTQSDTIDGYFIQNGVRVRIGDNTETSAVKTIKGDGVNLEYDTNNAVLTIKSNGEDSGEYISNITIEKDGDSFSTDTLSFAGNGVTLDTDNKIININGNGGDGSISADLNNEIISGITTLKAGENVGFRANESTPSVLQIYSNTAEVTQVGKAQRLKVYTVTSETEDGITNYGGKILPEGLIEGDIIGVNFATKFVANAKLYNKEIYGGSSETNIPAYIINSFGIFCYKNDRFYLLASDYGREGTINSISSKTEGNNGRIDISIDAEGFPAATAISELPNNLVYTETINNQQKINSDLLPYNLLYLEDQGYGSLKINEDYLPDELKRGLIHLINGTDVYVDNIDPETLIFVEGAESATPSGGESSGGSSSAIAKATITPPIGDSSEAILNISATLLRQNCLLVLTTAQEWDNEQGYPDLKIKVYNSDIVGDFCYNGGNYLPPDTITANDTLLFFHEINNGQHNFYLLSSDETTIGKRVSIGKTMDEDGSKTVTLYNQGKAYIVPVEDTNSQNRVLYGVSPILVEPDESNSFLNISLGLPSDYQEDPRGLFLNAQGEWTSMGLESLSDSLNSLIIDLAYPVGSIYYTEKNEYEFDPNGRASEYIQDNITDWTSDGMYKWTHVTNGTVHQWTKRLASDYDAFDANGYTQDDLPENPVIQGENVPEDTPNYSP